MRSESFQSRSLSEMRSFEKVCALCVLVAICIDNAIALRNSSITLYPETNPLQIHLQKFVDQFSYDLSVEFLRKLPNAIVRSTATEFPILKSISNYPVTSVTVLIISAIFTYFISPFVSGEWVQQVTGIDVNFWENKIDEIGRNVKQALEATKNIDSDACIKMAMCEFGKRKESRDRGQQASVAINVFDYILQ